MKYIVTMPREYWEVYEVEASNAGEAEEIVSLGNGGLLYDKVGGIDRENSVTKRKSESWQKKIDRLVKAKAKLELLIAELRDMGMDV